MGYYSNSIVIKIYFKRNLKKYFFSICNPLMRYDQNPCSTKIISPSLFSPRRLIIPLSSTLQSSSTEQFIQQNQKSNHLIIIVKLF